MLGLEVSYNTRGQWVVKGKFAGRWETISKPLAKKDAERLAIQQVGYSEIIIVRSK